MGSGDLSAVAHHLYGLDPGEFTAARNQAAKQAKDDGDKELAAAIKALPKASTAAWLVNQLVRHKADEIEELLAVGEALREATADADAAQLKDLNSKRRAVLAAMTRQARALARELGHPVSDGIANEVEETLHAGLVDVAAGDAVRSGRLVAALSPAGFGSVDLTGAVAGGEPVESSRSARKAGPAQGPRGDEAERKRAAELEAARAAAEEADAELEQATAEAEVADEAAVAARERAEQAQAAVDEATEALRRARAALDEAEAEARAAGATQREAAKALTAAQRAADKAADAVAALE
jgi:hypothetical protein